MNDRGFRAIVLDLFDTLVKWSPQRLPEMEIRGRRVHSTLPLLAPTVERGLGSGFDLSQFIESYSAVLNEIERERLARAVEVTCHERFRRTLERLGAASIDGLAEELTRVHMAAVRGVTAAPEEYAAVVRRLARCYRMGLLSNFDDARTGHEILADTGVSELFEVVVISAEVDVRKPNPVIFRHLLDRLRLAPDEVLFVGDTAHEDVAGARGAGIPVVWLSDNKGGFPPDVAAPDFTIRNLTELPGLLGVE
ncbi:MAG TPA: HAD family hydrolase [Candidatus Binatia bacterium]|nr:HAD family hydrolase [Candidatus Binatia bacterium]